MSMQSDRKHPGFIPTVITKYTFVKVAGNDGAIFYHTVLNAIPQAETGQHSSVPADDPGVLVGAVFPIGAVLAPSRRKWSPAGRE